MDLADQGKVAEIDKMFEGKLKLENGSTQAHEAQALPAQAMPVGTQPVEAQPVEAQPVKAQPVKAQPVEAQPVAVLPAGIHPDEAQPAKALPIGTLPAGTQPAQVQPAQVTEHKTYSDLPREMQDKIMKLLIPTRPSPKVDLLPGKLEIFASNVRAAVNEYWATMDGVLLTRDTTMIVHYHEIGMNLFRSIKHDIESFKMLDEFCACDGQKQNPTAWHCDRPELTPRRLRMICEQRWSRDALAKELTGVDYGHVLHHDQTKQLDLQARHEQLINWPYLQADDVRRCGTLKFRRPEYFCSPQCRAEGPYDDYTASEIDRFRVRFSGTNHPRSSMFRAG